jgi:serine/threonine protein phosphatase PrpC
MTQLIFKACGISDIGKVRKNNEDVWADLSDIHCYLLADGMGGHQAGEVAAKETVDWLCRTLKKNLKSKTISLDEALKVIDAAVQSANSHVYKLGRSTLELKGMGTTLCLLYLHPEGAVYAHIGDSRIYRIRDKKIKLMTEDHSLFSELAQSGKIGNMEREEFHYKNIITKAVGTEPHIKPTIAVDSMHSKDLYLLCTDGLSDLLTPAEMEKIINEASSLSLAASELVALSKDKGGHDNVTALLVGAK